MLNKIVVITLSLVLSASMLFAVDFSGTWTLNKDKSEMGEGRGRFNSTKLDVKQNDKEITIERTGQGRNGEYTRTATITLDGKENELEGFRGSTRNVTANWSDDKKSLEIASLMKMERNGEQLEITSKEVWKMDGDNLVLDLEMNSPRGERKSKLVYNKAK
jgi:hypothetical protein